MKVYGAAETTCGHWYNQGIRSIEDLKRRTDLTSEQHKAGIKYYDDFQVRIPREEVSVWGDGCGGSVCCRQLIPVYWNWGQGRLQV